MKDFSSQNASAKTKPVKTNSPDFMSFRLVIGIFFLKIGANELLTATVAVIFQLGTVWIFCFLAHF